MTGAGPGRNQRWVMACVLIVLGVVALAEGWRLHALRTQLIAGAVVGDDTLPLITGVALIVLGILVAVVAPPQSVKVMWPSGAQRTQMLSAAGLLAAYWAMLPYIGYTGSTAVVSLGLYRAMGNYRWPTAALLAAATTGILFLVFRVWLQEPLPTGWLGQ
jgi:putative tricarboxylic transport membrane protein